MNVKKKFLNAALFNNYFIGVCAVALTAASYSDYHQLSASRIPSLIFIFCSTVFAYSFHAVIKYSKTDSSFGSIRVSWLVRNRKWLSIQTIIFFVLSMFFTLFLKWENLVMLVPMAIIVYFYTNSLRVNGRSYSFKNIAFLKVSSVALVWTSVTTILPAIEANYWSNDVAGTFALRFFLILALCIPFDIRDLNIDLASFYQTIATDKGKNYSKAAALFFILVFLILSGLTGNFFPEGVITLVPTLGFVIYSGKTDSEYFYSLYGDGILLLYSINILLF